jgi:hypothetical protein
MKLFKEQPEKTERTFSIKAKQLSKTFCLTLVDSQSGEFISHLADFSDDGIFFHRNVTECLKDMGYAYDQDMFEESNGSLKIINH